MAIAISLNQNTSSFAPLTITTISSAIWFVIVVNYGTLPIFNSSEDSLM